MIMDENVPLAAGDETGVPTTTADTEGLDTTMINDQQTPLAANNQNGMYCSQECDCRKTDKMYWWWVLAIIGSITGKAAYDQKNRYDEEKAEKESRKRAKERHNRADDLDF